MKIWVLLFALAFAPAYADVKGDCGTVIVPSDSDITSFNPEFADSVGNGQAGALLYPDLIWINRYAKIDWPRSLITSVSTPDNGITYDMTLRPWHWSDGVPITSADVLYDWQLILEMGSNYPGYGSGGIPMNVKSVTALDAMHVRVVLTHPVNPTWFIYNGLSQLGPLPVHDWGRYTLDQLWQLQTTPSFFKVVAGPFFVQRLDVGQDAVFVPNPRYDGPPLHMDRFIFKFINGDGAAVQQVEAGDVDYAALPKELFKAVPMLHGVHLEQGAPPASFDELIPNLRNPQVAFFQDVRVREAMADAIDQEGMIKLVLHGYGYPVYTAVPPADASMLAPQLAAGHYPVGYDPAKARALLKEAGYTPGPDGIMQKNGKRLSFVDFMESDSSEAAEMTEFIQSDLRAVGIEMTIRDVEFNQLIAAITGPPDAWQATMLGQDDGGYPSGEAFFQTGAYHDENGYTDKTMDTLINASVYKPGMQGLYDFELYASAQQPVIFLPAPGSLRLVSNRLHGMNDYVDPAGQLSPDQLYCTVGGGK